MSRRRAGAIGSPDQLSSTVGLVLAACVLAVLGLSLDRITDDQLRGIVTFLGVLVIGVPILGVVARREPESKVADLLVVAFITKLGFSLVRYFVLAVVYGDNADAGKYSEWATPIVGLFRQGIFSLPEGGFTGRDAETERIAIFLAFVYLITGVSRFAGTFVFTSLCFAGQVLMWRAFRRAVPNGDDVRYGLLVFFLPSMLFWPSSIGKDALMVGCVGLVSYGAAQVLGDRTSVGGIAVFGAGVAGLMAIRPHMGLIAIVALAVGATAGSIGGIRKKGASKSAMVRLAALVVLVGLGSVGVSQFGKLFGSDDGGEGTSITSALDKTKTMTGTGGSEYQPVAVSSPLDLPAAVVTVLIRPFPWEARNVNGLIAASEGVLFVGLAIAGRRRLLAWLQELPKNPYLVFCAVYALVFIVLFSYIGNFGILARQRTQMLPLVLVAFAMHPKPKVSRRSLLRERSERRQAESQEPMDALSEPNNV
ncbi:MAG: hypothetical protein M9952_02665 [Microthrixaceae bacterium]|nr:hypothetical protein [Microthrixaceae bacterium]